MVGKWLWILITIANLLDLRLRILLIDESDNFWVC